jgi:hypothetical protein
VITGAGNRKIEAGKPNFTAEAQRSQRKAIERKDKSKKAVKRGAGSGKQRAVNSE